MNIITESFRELQGLLTTLGEQEIEFILLKENLMDLASISNVEAGDEHELDNSR